jgi:hypothetical protein
MLDMHRWQRAQGDSMQRPSDVQLSRPVLGVHAQELVGVSLLQYWPPATLQSLSAAQVPAGLVMFSMGYWVSAVPLVTPSVVHMLKLPRSVPLSTLRSKPSAPYKK